MLGLFKKKSPKEKLEAKYKKLLAEAHSLSSQNRAAGDKKMAEAEELRKEMEKLD